ncbi:sodium- and chloride-dependent glycine transporter 2-like isoform X2 [Dermacentor andersoni]|nr:sodium- and chloride-dependent glycine transporter 2-like isoform X2 [Dermacentor andersoni]
MVPYIVLMLVLGRPMYYLELVLGQFASNAQARAFGGFPLAKGVGWAMVYACAFISLYYNVILGYALLYLVYSFSGTLPWTSCDYSDWADSDCYNPRPGVVPCRTVEPRLLRLYAGENYTGPDAHAILHGSDVVLVPRQAYELLANSCTMATQTAPEQFFYRHVLGLSSGIEDLGSLQPRLAIALVVSWLCVYLCIFKGIKSAGKAVYVTSLAPFLILGMLFVRGITLPGASDGIRFYLVPDWSIIMRARVWKNAAEQIFYSLSLAEGMIICFGGFNEFRNRLHKDVLVVAAADFVVSLMGGMVVFSVLGNMAYNMDVPVNDVVSSGVGLAFIAYPQALSMIAYPQIWSAAFYAMLFFLAIDTEFSSVECLLTPFKDQFPALRSHGPLLSFAVCALMCVFGMPMASQGGLYILTVMDTYLGGYLLPWIGLAELLVVLLGYGLTRFCADIEFMTGDQPGVALKICWAVFCPLCLTWIVIADLFLYGEPLTLGEYAFPTWVNVVGTYTVIVAVKIIAAFALYHLHSCGYDLHKALLPSHNWGPKDPVDHREYLCFLRQRGMSRLSEQDPQLLPPLEDKSGTVSSRVPPVGLDHPVPLAEAAAPLPDNAPANPDVTPDLPDVHAAPPAAITSGANITAAI